MAIFAAKVWSLVLIMGTASAKLIAPLAHSQAEVQDPCPVDDAGVPAAPVISERDARFASFRRISDNFEKWMNLSIDPCEDFYAYACKRGQTNNLHSQARFAIWSSHASQLAAYNDGAYFANAAKPLKQLKHLYDKCVRSDATAAAVAESIKTKFETMKQKIGVTFPMAYQAEELAALSEDDLANLIGYPISELWEGNVVKVSARVYIDQTNLMYSPDVYTNWTYNKPMQDLIETEITADMNEFALTLGVTLDQAKLKIDASAVAEMEYALRDYVTDKNARRNFERLYNLRTVAELQEESPAYDWINLLKAALAKAQAPELITDTLEVVVMEPEQTAKLSRDIAAKKFDAKTIANYIYYRVLIGLRQHAPPISDQQEVRKTSVLRQREEEPGIFDRRVGKWLTIEDISVLGEQLNLELPDTQVQCLLMADTNMPRAADRLYIDHIYPTSEERASMRQELEELTKWIFNGFRTQIDQISWMSAASKRGAYKKMDNIQLNILYSEWITDDEQLTEFYSKLLIDDSFNTIQTYDAIIDFRLTRAVENFRLNNPRDRAEFNAGSAATVDMSYNPFFNSLNVFAGIVQPPIYDSKYPAAAKFGDIGTVIGHELTHGFDDHGVQTDYIGAVNNWMDDASYAGFQDMANCVIKEYDAFCPGSNICIDGVNTQGENIADNGGLQAGYNAFQDYAAYYGPDPRLPGFASKFNNNQLFFLSFAHGWCSYELSGEEYEEYKYDPHSPQKYRVFGTIQNFPAFRTAFNCPVGSAYAPKDHCDVWTSPPGA